MTDPEDRPEPDRIEGALHPRETVQLIGQANAETGFLDAFNANRLHHAWLLTGPKGIGKATLAWRIARFLLTTPTDDGDSLFGDAPPAPTSLDTDPEHPVSRRMTALSEPRLYLLRRAWDDKADRLKTVISVDDVRGLKGFFSLSAADGGRRVVIVDAADEMNNAAANALLKVLEEPPDDSILILISHQPSSLLPTIRSRCRTLRLDPLEPKDMQTALSHQAIADNIPAQTLSELAGGSLGEAIRLINMGGAETYAGLIALFSTLPGLDRNALIKLADSTTGRTAQPRLGLLLDLFDILLARLARTGTLGHPPPEAVSEEAALLSRLSPSPAAARAWADLQQQLSERTRHGIAVNLDPAALILDMGFRIDQVAAKWTA